MNAGYDSFDAVRTRLDEIVDEVNAEGVSLDEALKLYEEAVKLGLQACDLSEEDAAAFAAAAASDDGANEAPVGQDTAEGDGSASAGHAARADVPSEHEEATR